MALSRVQPGHRRRRSVVRAGPRAALSPLRHQPGHGRTSSTFTPSSSRTGRGRIDVTLPKPGYYQVLSDFLPTGGASQLIARPLVTAGYAGDLAGNSARLVPDTSLDEVVDDITASVSFDPPPSSPASTATSSFTLTDTKTGRPITDLQTYLGAFGHTLIMSEDMLDYVHSHSLDILAADDDDSVPQFIIPPGSDLEELRGGPDVIVRRTHAKARDVIAPGRSSAATASSTRSRRPSRWGTPCDESLPG